MPTRPDQPDPSGAAGPGANAFAGLGAGLGFFQDWMKAASSALPNLSGAAAPGAPAWTMPTLDPEELDKRIQDLKTVQFWLEQNARMIGMTIQTLEVQRMTLNTLREMKVPVDALRESLKAQVPTSEKPAAPTPAPAEPEADHAATPGVNPMAWWGTLTEQFTTLASQAVQAGQEAMSAAAPVVKAAADANVEPKAAARPSTAKPPVGKTAASRRKTNSAPADDAPSATSSSRRTRR